MSGSSGESRGESRDKRQRVEEEKQADADVRLCEELQELMGGRKYIKGE
jgi:hypothetical protein